MFWYISVRSTFDDDNNMALIANSVFGAMDAVLTITMMILFIVPIAKLMNALQSNSEDNRLAHISMFNEDPMEFAGSVHCVDGIEDTEMSQFEADSMDFGILSRTYTVRDIPIHPIKEKDTRPDIVSLDTSLIRDHTA